MAPRQSRPPRIKPARAKQAPLALASARLCALRRPAEADCARRSGAARGNGNDRLAELPRRHCGLLSTRRAELRRRRHCVCAARGVHAAQARRARGALRRRPPSPVVGALPRLLGSKGRACGAPAERPTHNGAHSAAQRRARAALGLGSGGAVQLSRGALGLDRLDVLLAHALQIQWLSQFQNTSHQFHNHQREERTASN